MLTRIAGLKPLWTMLSLALAATLYGCPQQKVITCKSNEEYSVKLGACVPCPPGTKLDKSIGKCKPVEPVEDVPPFPDTYEPDTYEPDLKDTVVEPTDLDAGDTVGPDLTKPDIKEIVPDGSVGSACNKDADCNNGLNCFDWPNGYCIKTGCTSSQDCPQGASCLPLLDNGQACFQSCEGNQQCRNGYGCKGLAALGGETKNICHPISDKKLPLGMRCEGAQECDGSMGCVQLGPVAMCTETGCSDQTACPEGAKCVALTAVPVCLPDCSSDLDCDPAFGETIACQETKDIFNKPAKVCGSSNYGLAVGQLCYFNSECSTGYCHLLFVGKCTDSGKLCSSDRDCALGFCTEDPSSQRGICSKECGSGDPCPSGNLCIMAEETPVCMATCTDAGSKCGPSGYDMTCTYGMVHYPQAAGGKLACFKRRTGDEGSGCDANADCLNGDCFYQQGSDGYCMGACISNTQCTFGSTCDGALCRLMCSSDLDCPSGQTCLTDVSTSDNICKYELQ